MTKKELWTNVRAYHFDNIVPPNLWDNIINAFGGTNASTKAFAAKIARKHQWNKSFALLAISEYKKFVYLGVVSNFHVTPSKIIDIIWHEHLLFTKAYREFCHDVLHYQFDHHPELLPIAEETGRFSAQYLDTIEFYILEFGKQPPISIWGNTKFDKERIKEAAYQSREKNSTVFSNDSGNTYYTDEPLHTNYDTNFDGGDFDGGGAGGDWSDGNGHDGSDSGDSGDGGGDGGGCSGGCGGGD
jgi:hypothetical protein